MMGQFWEITKALKQFQNNKAQHLTEIAFCGLSESVGLKTTEILHKLERQKPP